MPKVQVSKNGLWKAVRKHCLRCVGELALEVEKCTVPNCSLYNYRFGRPLQKGDVIYLGEGNYGRIDKKGQR